MNRYGLSTALFAPGWTYEVLATDEKYEINERKFWTGVTSPRMYKGSVGEEEEGARRRGGGEGGGREAMYILIFCSALLSSGVSTVPNNMEESGWKIIAANGVCIPHLFPSSLLFSPFLLPSSLLFPPFPLPPCPFFHPPPLSSPPCLLYLNNTQLQNGWKVEHSDNMRLFITSHDWCTRAQEVSLNETDLFVNCPQLLDYFPVVKIEANFIGGGPKFPDLYRLRVELRGMPLILIYRFLFLANTILDESHLPIDTFDSGIMAAMDKWQKLKFTFSEPHDGKKLRYIYWEDGGRDSEVGNRTNTCSPLLPWPFSLSYFSSLAAFSP